MSVGERDPYTGHMTTGHDWNGITELNRRVPIAIWLFLAGAVLFAVGYWLLMPAWPYFTGYTKGLLGENDRVDVTRELSEADASRTWQETIRTADLPAIMANPGLMTTVRQTGKTLFEDNCAVCHGMDATGGPGFPSLVDDSWLWGGSPSAVMHTLQVGINAPADDTQVSEMLNFGQTGVLNRDQVLNVVGYVQSLSGSWTGDVDITAGKAVFASTCAACHGADGKGLDEFGAPDLTDHFWIYGGDRESIFETVMYGRQGQMPSWRDRLSPVDLKLLAAYVLDLGQKAGTTP